MRDEEMTLERALHILCQAHTEDDPELGFRVVAGAPGPGPWMPFSIEEYLEAWRIVRLRVHLPTEPTR